MQISPRAFVSRALAADAPAPKSDESSHGGGLGSPVHDPVVKAELDENIAAAQGWWSDHGQGRFAGNGPVKSVLMGKFDNAAFAGLPAGPLKFALRGMVLSDPKYAGDPEVLGHEMSHAVVTHLIGKQSGQNGEGAGVQESLADTFSHFMYPTDWGIGSTGKPIRTMGEWQTGVDPRDPEAFSQALFKQLVDEQGVPEDKAAQVAEEQAQNPDGHFLADVPNRVARTITESIGEQDATKVYLKALDEVPQVDFSGLAYATQQAAKSVFGDDAPQVGAVQQAWDSVGLTREAIIAGMKAGTNRQLAENTL